MIFAYLRISTKDKQSTDRQRERISSWCDAAGLKVDAWVEEKLSGKSMDRPHWQRLQDRLRPGDLLIVSDIDRIGRNADEVILVLKDLKQREIILAALDTPYLNDYAFLQNTLFGNPGSSQSLYHMTIDILVTMKAHIAQQEREKMIERINQGLEAARKKGRPIGRPPAPVPKDFKKYLSLLNQGKITKVEMAKLLGCSRQQVYRLMKKPS